MSLWLLISWLGLLSVWCLVPLLLKPLISFHLHIYRQLPGRVPDRSSVCSRCRSAWRQGNAVPSGQRGTDLHHSHRGYQCNLHLLGEYVFSILVITFHILLYVIWVTKNCCLPASVSSLSCSITESLPEGYFGLGKDGMLYLIPKQEEAFKNARSLCRRIPGHWLARTNDTKHEKALTDILKYNDIGRYSISQMLFPLSC